MSINQIIDNNVLLDNINDVADWKNFQFSNVKIKSLQVGELNNLNFEDPPAETFLYSDDQQNLQWEPLDILNPKVLAVSNSNSYPIGDEPATLIFNFTDYNTNTTDVVFNGGTNSFIFNVEGTYKIEFNCVANLINPGGLLELDISFLVNEATIRTLKNSANSTVNFYQTISSSFIFNSSVNDTLLLERVANADSGSILPGYNLIITKLD